MKKILLIFGMICILFVVECKKDTTTYTPDCSGTAKSYTTDVKPIISAYCSQCHSNFSNYTQVSASASSIRSKIVDGSMPKNSSLSTDQKNKIVCWIDNGAPNN